MNTCLALIAVLLPCACSDAFTSEASGPDGGGAGGSGTGGSGTGGSGTGGSGTGGSGTGGSGTGGVGGTGGSATGGVGGTGGSATGGVGGTGGSATGGAGGTGGSATGGAGGTGGSATGGVGGTGGSATGGVGGTGGSATGGAGGTGGSATGGAGGTGGSGGTQSGDCGPNKPCEQGQTCTQVTPGGFWMCVTPRKEATGCSANPGDECCTTADCGADGQCFAQPIVPFCGGIVVLDYNVCAVDQCKDNGDCNQSQLCVPRGAFGNAVRYCAPAACHTDADCIKHDPPGTCAPVEDPCCGRPSALYCVYPARGGCRESSDCDTGEYCAVDGDEARCTTGFPLCPA